MICRLCLKNINANNAVYLFETDDTLAESSLLKMIAKFLQLEVSFQSLSIKFKLQYNMLFIYP